MVMPDAGTFDYVAVVPEKPEDSSSPWPVQLREPVKCIGDPLHDDRLLGYSPSLQITDGGSAPSPAHPAIRRSRFTMTAPRQLNAGLSAASFYVDRELTRAFRPGDILHVARTPCAGLGLSLLRNGCLVLAVGAISAVPLGNNVQATTPHDLVQQTEFVFQQRDPAFELREYPIQISVDGKAGIMFGGVRQLGDYNIWVLHGFRNGEPGTDECVAIALKGVCGPAPATRSARWLEDELEMERW